MSSASKRIRVESSPPARHFFFGNTDLFPEALKYLSVVELIGAYLVSSTWKQPVSVTLQLQDSCWDDWTARFRLIHFIITGGRTPAGEPLAIFQLAREYSTIKSELALYLRNLKKARIDSPPKEISGLLPLVTELAPELHTLCLRGLVTNDASNGMRCPQKDLVSIGQLKRLTSFYYNAPEGRLDRDFFNVVASLPLTCFHLVHPGDPIIFKEMLRCIAKLPNLTSLVVPKEMSISPIINRFLGLTHLRRLDFSRISNLTDASFGELLSALPNLCQLNIGSMVSLNLSFQGIVDALCPTIPRTSPMTAFACNLLQLDEPSPSISMVRFAYNFVPFDSSYYSARQNAKKLANLLGLSHEDFYQNSYEFLFTNFNSSGHTYVYFGVNLVNNPLD